MKIKTDSFTLIEILIVITITILLSGWGLATYNNFTNQNNLKRETERLYDTLNTARKKAEASEELSTPCAGSFNGYRVDVNTTNESYTFSRCCLNGGTESCTAIRTYTLSSPLSICSSIYFDTVATLNSVLFKPLTLGTDIPLGSTVNKSRVQISIRNDNLALPNQCEYVNVGRNGNTVSYTDSPQACPAICP